MTSRTASKTRSGRSHSRSFARHNDNTDGWNPPSVSDKPAAAFHLISQRSRWIASRSDTHSNAWRTITVAITDPGTEGRPRPDPNKSPKQIIGKQAETPLSQEPVHRTLRHQIPAQPHRIQQLTVNALTTLHTIHNTANTPKTRTTPPPTTRLNQHPPSVLCWEYTVDSG